MTEEFKALIHDLNIVGEFRKEYFIEFLSKQSPEIVAILFSHMSPKSGIIHLKKLKPSFAASIISKMNTINEISNETLNDLIAQLRNDITKIKDTEPSKVEIIEAIRSIIPDAPIFDNIGQFLKSIRDTDEEEKLAAKWASEDVNTEMAEEERLAAEWAALAEQEESKIDQNEIDSLLGYEKESEKPKTRILTESEINDLLGYNQENIKGSAIEQMLGIPIVDYERLPLLEYIMEQFTRVFTTSLRNFTGENVEVSIDQIANVEFSNLLCSIPLPAMLSVVNAEEWDGKITIITDSALIYSMVDILLGGRKGVAAQRIEGRPYTIIERNIIERLVHLACGDLSAVFDPLTPVTFRFDSLETNPRFTYYVPPRTPSVIVKFRLDFEDRGGRFEILIPLSTIEPIRELLQQHHGSKIGKNPIWETHITETIKNVSIKLTAEINEDIKLSLGDILNLEINSKIFIENSEILLSVPGKNIAIAEYGSRDASGWTNDQKACARIIKFNPNFQNPNKTFKAFTPSKKENTMTEKFSKSGNLESAYDVKLKVRAVVGESELTISQLLKLGRGYVIELDRKLGEPLDIYLQDKLFAKAELVAVDDRLAIMLVELHNKPNIPPLEGMDFDLDLDDDGTDDVKPAE